MKINDFKLGQTVTCFTGFTGKVVNIYNGSVIAENETGERYVMRPFEVVSKEDNLTNVVINRSIPSRNLTAEQLVQRVKSFGQDCQSSYGFFVRERELKPEISMREFAKIFSKVSPDPFIETINFGIHPTHLDTLINKKVQITKTPTCYKMIWEHGMTGSEPTLSDRYVKL